MSSRNSGRTAATKSEARAPEWLLPPPRPSRWRLAVSATLLVIWLLFLAYLVFRS